MKGIKFISLHSSVNVSVGSNFDGVVCVACTLSNVENDGIDISCDVGLVRVQCWI